MISSNLLHLFLHYIVDDADFRDLQRRADLHGVDVPIVDQLVGQLAADESDRKSLSSQMSAINPFRDKS